MGTGSPFGDRLRRAADRLAAGDGDALIVSPGSDLRWLCGYDAVPLVRLTALVLTPGEVWAVVPALEVLAAAASPLGELDIPVHSYGEGEDPYALLASLLRRGLGSGPVRVAVDDRMWAMKALAIEAGLAATGTPAPLRPAGALLSGLRALKDPSEVQALSRAAAAIDAVHAQVPGMLHPGRSEREIAREISEAIIAAGHSRVDFVIVASGPNAASPHHEPAERILGPGDAVIVDIGGTMPDGYRSDETRTYALAPVAPEVHDHYCVLQEAQQRAVAAVAPGVALGVVDAAARDHLTAAGLGHAFIHRTGHGIGLDTHEEPYLAAGAAAALVEGMVFSVEPGVYLPGRWGARLEDIVVCTATGASSLTCRPRGLQVLS